MWWVEEPLKYTTWHKPLRFIKQSQIQRIFSKWKITSNKRWPQKPLIGSFSIFKLKLWGLNWKQKLFEMKMTSIGRQPENLKVEYLSNYWFHLSQILNLSLGAQTESKSCMKLRRIQLEDDLKIPKVEYHSKHWLDLTQIL